VWSADIFTCFERGVMSDDDERHVVVNHHADSPGFAGIAGFAAAMSMLLGRGPVSRLALAQADVTAQDRVVDIGCGHGAAARAAARRGAQVIGVDPAPVMLRVARALTRGNTTVTWMRGTAEAVPLGDGAATVLSSIATIHHWDDVDAALAEAHRVLAPGGRLLAIERRTRPGAKGVAGHGWTDDQAAAFAVRCQAAGFSDIDSRTCQAGRRSVFVVRATRASL
jgi:ubiquinone/menaquinone biosynthesis C-methylase UbiE